ncbi:MAG: putative multi-domain protein [uncultured Phycisphaerae bacterium]|uniref:Putative multi-domain protein n=1 Tax=uncultured Phycisphaerae bacterium TaxID=904963 RepID=A0A6J4PA04_9BACT|nr:MAG: putative multi-domain protein [uncultured Phycisphaerae bacterium]
MSGKLACCPVARNVGRFSIVAVVAAGLFVAVQSLSAKEHEKPDNAVMLFDGKDLSKWQHRDGSAPKWKVEAGGEGGGAMVVNGGDIVTKEKFKGDFILHVEFAPNDVGPGPTGQARGNSGVYLQENYEVQVLDSYGVEKLAEGDCAGLYGLKPADKNMAKKPGEWQTYHIEFTAPKFEGEKKVKNARVTVYWNGEKVHDDVEIPATSGGGKGESPAGGGISLQDHGNPVKYRNIWIAPKGEKK